MWPTPHVDYTGAVLRALSSAILDERVTLAKSCDQWWPRSNLDIELVPIDVNTGHKSLLWRITNRCGAIVGSSASTARWRVVHVEVMKASKV